jgi:hypothetical protein
MIGNSAGRAGVNYSGSATYFVRLISAADCVVVSNNKAGKATNVYDGGGGSHTAFANR